MNINKIGSEISSLCNLLKAAALYAESIRQCNVSFEYKNMCTSVIRTQKQLEEKIKWMNPSGKEYVDTAMEDDKVHYISEVVLLMSSIGTDGCKEIFDTLKKHID
jgi:hypothetical protein